MRWFQFGAFCPLFRLHGVREPGPLVGSDQTGAPNEVWSFGDEAYGIITRTAGAARAASALRDGTDGHRQCHRGPAHAGAVPGVPGRGAGLGGGRRVHVRPGHPGRPGHPQGAREREVYLPEGASWLDAWTGEPVEENGWVTAPAPLERIPVYLRRGGAFSTLSGGSEIRAEGTAAGREEGPLGPSRHRRHAEAHGALRAADAGRQAGATPRPPRRPDDEPGAASVWRAGCSSPRPSCTSSSLSHLPIIYNVMLSFEQSSPATISSLTAPFAGLANYRFILSDPTSRPP